MERNIEVNPVYYDGIVYSFLLIETKRCRGDIREISMVKAIFFRPSRRGILFHPDKINNKKSILITSGNRLYKFDSKTGDLDKEFGKAGSIFVRKTLFAPLVYKSQIPMT